MRIIDAPNILHAATNTIIALQMARTLYYRRADLSSETCVRNVLAREGFGAYSICALRCKATEVARVFRDEGTAL